MNEVESAESPLPYKVVNITKNQVQLEHHVIIARAQAMQRLNEALETVTEIARKQKSDGPPSQAEKTMQSILVSIEKLAAKIE